MEEEYSAEITKRFMELYREIDPMLYSSSRKYEEFYRMHSVELDAIRHMRNILAHSKTPGAYPFLVSKKALLQLESILGFLRTPCSGVGASTICSVSTEDSFASAVRLMSAKNYSFLPILDVKEKLVGVVSESSILRAMASGDNEGLIYDSKSKVSSFMDCFGIGNNPNEFFEFRKPDTFLYQIEPDFSRFSDDEKKLGAIFVTTTGDSEGIVLRMITPWDLLPYLSKTFHYISRQ